MCRRLCGQLGWLEWLFGDVWWRRDKDAVVHSGNSCAWWAGMSIGLTADTGVQHWLVSRRLCGKLGRLQWVFSVMWGWHADASVRSDDACSERGCRMSNC